jgi:hypothetical protein
MEIQSEKNKLNMTFSKTMAVQGEGFNAFLTNT